MTTRSIVTEIDTGPRTLSTTDLAAAVGNVIGTSDWHVVAQGDANAFGSATHDEQWIHTDPVRAAHGPFGRAIAHGYLTLALATFLVDEVYHVPDAVMVVNYGVDKVRFPAPLPLGAEVRAEITLSTVRRFTGGLQAGLHLVYEVRGQAKPCCVADILLRYYTADSL